MQKGLEPDTQLAPSSLHLSSEKKRPLTLKIIKELPKSLKPKAIERAVEQFVFESHCEDDQTGLYNQTLETIAQATFLSQTGASQFWLVEDEAGEVAGYAIGSISKDVDNRLCYFLSQAWIAPAYRDGTLYMDCLKQIEAYARHHFCKHMIILSSREEKPYLRFLNRMDRGWHRYVTLLKKNLEE